MNILKTSSKERSSQADVGTTTTAEFDKAYSVQKADFDRGARAWRRYFPIEYGKWDADALKVLQEEFRHPVQFDIVGPKVDTLAGSLVSDLPDPTWSPVQGQKGLLTEAIAESYFTDKDLYNFDDVLLKVFRDGLVHCGDCELIEDYRFHTPRISLVRIMYGFLVWEPYWLTDDDRDAEVCYRVAYMNAAKLIKKYQHATDEILREAKAYKKDMSNYQPNPADRQKQLDGRVGDEFQVIEKHFLEHIKTTRLLGRQEGGMTWIPFPIGKDRAYLEAFAEINRIDWTTVIEDTYDDRIHYVTTVVRELSNAEIQVEKKSKIQVNGLPYYHFTTMRYGGKNMGYPETMEGVEDTINKRESLVTELISKANGGSSLVNEELFPDPKKRQEWTKKKNKPGHAEFVPLDGVKKTMENIANNQYPNAVIDQINRMYDKVLPLVSRVSDAMNSAAGSDSGILFERKFQTNMIANTLINRGMRQFINNIAEGYFYQWQITYANHEHEVVFRDGKTSVILNQRVGDMVYNDVKSVPRCRVVIAENTKSQTYQMRWRSVWSEMLTAIRPDVAPAHYMLALKNFFETIQVNDEDKAQVKALNELVMMIARLNLVSQAAKFQTDTQSSTLQGMQVDMQIQQMMSQLNQQFQQPQPQGHMEPQASQQIQYPQQGVNQQQEPVPQGAIESMNPPTVEAVSGGMPTSPAMTGAPQ
jgi:hypothetical protein